MRPVLSSRNLRSTMPQFVFRNGSPLDPAALRMVAATDAASVVLCRCVAGTAWLTPLHAVHCLLCRPLPCARAAKCLPAVLSQASPFTRFLPLLLTKCSDCSLPSRESDALVLRAAVLLDEMVEAERPDGGGPNVAAQVRD